MSGFHYGFIAIECLYKCSYPGWDRTVCVHRQHLMSSLYKELIILQPDRIWASSSPWKTSQPHCTQFMTWEIKHRKATMRLLHFHCRAGAKTNNMFIRVYKIKNNILISSSRVLLWLTCKRLRKQSAGVVLAQRPGRRRRRRKRSRTRRSRRRRRRRRPRKTITDRSIAALKR